MCGSYLYIGLKTNELNLVQNLLVTLHSQNKWAAVASTKPQKEQVSSISEYLAIEQDRSYPIL